MRSATFVNPYLWSVFIFLFYSHIQGQTNVIVNGDFESGDLTGWSAMNTGMSLGWNINDGTYTGSCASLGPLSNRPPISGNYDIISDQRAAGMNLISTGFIVPDPINSASIGWDMMYDNSLSSGNPQFQDPNQEFRVVILDSAMIPVDTLWSTDPGDPNQLLVPTRMTLQISEVFEGGEGEMFYLLFQEDDNLGCFNVVIDNVELTFSQAAVPTISEWGGMILFQLILIIGVLYIKSRALYSFVLCKDSISE